MLIFWFFRPPQSWGGFFVLKICIFGANYLALYLIMPPISMGGFFVWKFEILLYVCSMNFTAQYMQWQSPHGWG